MITTLMSAPVAYGIFLFLTLPVLSGLLGALFVGGGDATARVWASLLGPVLLINVVWLQGAQMNVPSKASSLARWS